MTRVLVSVTACAWGLQFAVVGVARDGIERPAALTVEEYALAYDAATRDLDATRMRAGARILRDFPLVRPRHPRRGAA